MALYAIFEIILPGLFLGTRLVLTVPYFNICLFLTGLRVGIRLVLPGLCLCIYTSNFLSVSPDKIRSMIS
jgi:hypothetical protein